MRGSCLRPRVMKGLMPTHAGVGALARLQEASHMGSMNTLKTALDEVKQARKM